MGAILTEEWETGDCQLWFIAPLPAKALAGENTIADNSDSPDTGTETETASSDSSRPGDKLSQDTFFAPTKAARMLV